MNWEAGASPPAEVAVAGVGVGKSSGSKDAENEHSNDPPLSARFSLYSENDGKP